MSFAYEVLDPAAYARDAAAYVADRLPSEGAVVITGGGTAAKVYPELAGARSDWTGIDVYFSDERRVPPDHDASNYGTVKPLLLERIAARRVHRMRGEDPPQQAADDYHLAIAAPAREGFDLVLLGMGPDGHICSLFPGSPALGVTASFCVPVKRPDGLGGLTLTPPALLGAKRIILLVTGADKAPAVARAIAGDDDPETLPVRVLHEHPDATFVLDEAAAARLPAAD